MNAILSTYISGALPLSYPGPGMVGFVPRGRRRRSPMNDYSSSGALPIGYTPAQRTALRVLPKSVRELRLADLADNPHYQHHIGRLQNRRVGVLTVGEVVDAELKGELLTWPGMGPTLASWVRTTLLRLAGWSEDTAKSA